MQLTQPSITQNLPEGRAVTCSNLTISISAGANTAIKITITRTEPEGRVSLLKGSEGTCLPKHVLIGEPSMVWRQVAEPSGGVLRTYEQPLPAGMAKPLRNALNAVKQLAALMHFATVGFRSSQIAETLHPAEVDSYENALRVILAQCLLAGADISAPSSDAVEVAAAQFLRDNALDEIRQARARIA